MTTFTGRYLAVVKAALRDGANAAARRIDPDGGELTFTVPLRRGTTGTTVVAYWASLVVTPEQGRTLDEHARAAALVGRVIVEPGETPPSWTAGRVWLFRADENLPGAWTPETVLAALGLSTIPPPP